MSGNSGSRRRGKTTVHPIMDDLENDRNYENVFRRSQARWFLEQFDGKEDSELTKISEFMDTEAEIFSYTIYSMLVHKIVTLNNEELHYLARPSSFPEFTIQSPGTIIGHTVAMSRGRVDSVDSLFTETFLVRHNILVNDAHTEHYELLDWHSMLEKYVSDVDAAVAYVKKGETAFDCDNHLFGSCGKKIWPFTALVESEKTIPYYVGMWLPTYYFDTATSLEKMICKLKIFKVNKIGC